MNTTRDEEDFDWKKNSDLSSDEHSAEVDPLAGTPEISQPFEDPEDEPDETSTKS